MLGETHCHGVTRYEREHPAHNDAPADHRLSAVQMDG